MDGIMSNQLEKQLIECLDALEQGGNLADILARYPENAAELRIYLETAVSLQTLNIQPTIATQQSSKKQFLETASILRQNKNSVPFAIRLQRFLLPLAGLALFLFLLTAVLLPVSAQTVPGDALYTTKRLIEDIRLSLTSSADGKLQLIDQYNQERIAEIKILLAEGRQENVSFRGPIEAVGEQSWIIASLTTQLADDVIIEGAPEIGLIAIVTGQTKDGALFALTITIPDGGKPTPELPPPSTTPTSTPTTTQTGSTPTATPTASVTNSPTPSPTVTETAISTATPTATEPATPTETATAVPTSTIPAINPPNNDNDDDNDNENSNESENENEGEDEDNDNSNDDDDDDNSNDDDDNDNSNDDDDDDNSNDDSNDNED